MKTIAKIDLWMTTIISYMATVAFISIAFSVTLGVVARLINISVPWTEEMSRYSLIWFVFTASLTGHQYIESTCVDALFKKLPFKTQRTVRNIYRVMMILFLLIVMWYGIDYAIMGLKKRMVTLPVPIFWVRLAIPFGCAFMCVKWLVLIILSYGSEDLNKEEKIIME